MYSTSSCEWSCIQHRPVSGLLERGGSEQHKGPQSLFVEGLLEGGGPWNNTRGRSLCLQVGVVVGCFLFL